MLHRPEVMMPQAPYDLCCAMQEESVQILIIDSML